MLRTKSYQKSANVSRSYSKNKSGTYFRDTVYVQCKCQCELWNCTTHVQRWALEAARLIVSSSSFIPFTSWLFSSTCSRRLFIVRSKLQCKTANQCLNWGEMRGNVVPPFFFQWGDLVRELWCRLILCHCTSNTLKGCGFNLPVTISCHLLRYKIVIKSQILRLNTPNSISAAAPCRTTPQIF